MLFDNLRYDIVLVLTTHVHSICLCADIFMVSVAAHLCGYLPIKRGSFLCVGDNWSHNTFLGALYSRPF